MPTDSAGSQRPSLAAAALDDAIRQAALDALGDPSTVAAAVVDGYARACADAIREGLPAAVTAALERTK